ncbi:MAG: preprotein translocase subunit SecG [Sphingomonadales bacterium]|nr:preprotein translocase subunit SecG [Sphingomonadales bacterium]
MSLLIFLTVLQAVIAALLVGVILMQQSEGGGLGVGGSPTGLMSARGAADFLTRMTTILATLFVALSIVLAALAAASSGDRPIEDTLNRSAVPGAVQQPVAPADPLNGGSAPAGAQPAPAASASPANGGLDPLAVPKKQ